MSLSRRRRVRVGAILAIIAALASRPFLTGSRDRAAEPPAAAQAIADERRAALEAARDAEREAAAAERAAGTREARAAARAASEVARDAAREAARDARRAARDARNASWRRDWTNNRSLTLSGGGIVGGFVLLGGIWVAVTFARGARRRREREALESSAPLDALREGDPLHQDAVRAEQREPLARW
jgi:hypothetical protein